MVTKVFKNKICVVPLNMCCNVLVEEYTNKVHSEQNMGSLNVVAASKSNI